MTHPLNGLLIKLFGFSFDFEFENFNSDTFENYKSFVPADVQSHNLFFKKF